MATVTITINDAENNSVTLNGASDDDLSVPTPALIVASYIATHAEQIVAAADVWFGEQIRSQEAPE
jgi:hypothetical protein